MNLFTYTKERKKFGRQCIFSDVSTQIFHQIGDPSLYSQYIRTNPNDVYIQNVPAKASSDVNTTNDSYNASGLNHTEGGWPKDININDEEQTARYKKRIERDEKYEKQLKHICPPMEDRVSQNIAVNVFEKYFTEDDLVCDEPECVTIDSIRCFINSESGSGVANHISFSPKIGENMVVAYTSIEFPIDEHAKHMSCVWNINYSQVPTLRLECESSLMQLEYNGKDEFIIAGGRADGIINIYDTRVGGDPQLCAEKEFSHKDPISSLLWIQSKANTELFTGAADGNVMWWDTRSMLAPYEQFALKASNENASNANSAIGCSILEYSYSMPSRFMVGTDIGTIFSGNKRGATYVERFPYSIACFGGPIRGLERNPFSDKYFLTIGDYSIKIWSDDCREKCIMLSKEHKDSLTCGTWNKNRSSTFFVGKANGAIDLWDILFDQKSPIASIKKINSPVNHICSHPNGYLAAVGHTNGEIHLLQISDIVSSNQRNDRSLMSETFERELGREKNFLAKVREFRLLLATENTTENVENINSDEEIEEITEEQVVKVTAKEFDDVLERLRKST